MGFIRKSSIKHFSFKFEVTIQLPQIKYYHDINWIMRIWGLRNKEKYLHIVMYFDFVFRICWRIFIILFKFRETLFSAIKKMRLIFQYDGGGLLQKNVYTIENTNHAAFINTMCKWGMGGKLMFGPFRNSLDAYFRIIIWSPPTMTFFKQMFTSKI